MENKLIVRESKIDWLEIINMALNRKDWGKTYTLFSYQDASIQCTMQSFDFIKNMATFQVKAIFTEHSELDVITWTEKEYFMNNFTVEEFNRSMLRCVRQLINSITYNLNRAFGEKKYADIKYTRWTISKDTFEMLVEQYHLNDVYEKIKSIADESIRTDCIYDLKGTVCSKANERYDSKLAEIIMKRPIDVTKLNIIGKKIDRELGVDD